jgi:hypothetical protein
MFNKKFKVSEQVQSPFQSPKLDLNCKKEAKKWEKLRNNNRAYSKERKKQREHLEKEIAVVNKFFEEGSISKDIHSRYLKMLEMGYTQKIQETRDKYGFPNLKLTPQSYWRKTK